MVYVRFTMLYVGHCMTGEEKTLGNFERFNHTSLSEVTFTRVVYAYLWTNNTFNWLISRFISHICIVMLLILL